MTTINANKRDYTIYAPERNISSVVASLQEDIRVTTGGDTRVTSQGDTRRAMSVSAIGYPQQIAANKRSYTIHAPEVR